MQKSLMIAVILTALSTGLLFWAYSGIQGEKETIEIEETVLAGDPEAAEGIVLENTISCNYHLFWDTVCRFGETFQTKTSFSFSQKRNYESAESDPYVGVGSIFDFSMSGVVDLEQEQDPGISMPLELIKDAAKRTGNGQVHTEWVTVRDYYTYYPLTLELHAPNRKIPSFDETENTGRLLSEFLKLPVPEDHIVKVSVRKDMAGQITDVECSSVKGYQVFSEGAVTEQGCYLTATVVDDLGKPAEGAEQKGIYCIPFAEKDEYEWEPNLSGMKLVYPLTDKQLLYMETSFDGDSLLLITREEGTLYFSVLNMEAEEIFQKTELAGMDDSKGIVGIQTYEDFIVVLSASGVFFLLENGPEGGNYEIAMTGDFSRSGQAWETMLYDYTVMDYDGQRLAAASADPYGREKNASFYLSVYDQTGPRYVGRYDCSLERDLPADHYDVCRFVEKDPLRLEFAPSSV